MTREEFDKRIVELRPILTNFALKLLNNRQFDNRHLARDLVQDTYLKALVHNEQYLENDSLLPWMFTILKNTFINEYNKRSRNKVTFMEDLSYLNSIDNYSSPESIIAEKDLQKIINNLKPTTSQIAFRMYMDGYQYREISVRLRIPLGTVKTRIHHAKKLAIKEIRNNNRILIQHLHEPIK